MARVWWHGPGILAMLEVEMRGPEVEIWAGLESKVKVNLDNGGRKETLPHVLK